MQEISTIDKRESKRHALRGRRDGASRGVAAGVHRVAPVRSARPRLQAVSARRCRDRRGDHRRRARLRAVEFVRRPAPARAIALVTTGFAIVSFLVRLSFTVRGGDVTDVTFHALGLPLLIYAFVVMWATGGVPRDAAQIRPKGEGGARKEPTNEHLDREHFREG